MLAFLSTWAAFGLAQDDPAKVPPGPPAVLDLLLPGGATVTVDDKDQTVFVLDYKALRECEAAARASQAA